jgi:hypothetical protein
LRGAQLKSCDSRDSITAALTESITVRMQSRARRILELLCLGIAVTYATLMLAYARERPPLSDFDAWVNAAERMAAGQNPYELGAGLATNINPPASLLVLKLVSISDRQSAFEAWFVISLTLYVLGAIILLREHRRALTPLLVAWLLAFTGLWDTLVLGQIYMPLFLLAVGAWLCLRRGRFLAAGVLIGCVAAIKVNFLIWPVFLALAGWWTVAMSAGATIVVLCLLPVLLNGPNVYLQWAAVLSAPNILYYPNNASLLGVGARLRIEAVAAVVVVALLIGLAIAVARARPGQIHTSELAITAALLAGPLAWTGYFVFLLPTMLSRPWSTPMWVAAVLMASPAVLLNPLALSTPILLATLGNAFALVPLLIAAVLVREMRARRALANCCMAGAPGICPPDRC